MAGNGEIYNKPAGGGSVWCETGNNPADIITMADSDVRTGWPLSGTPPSRQRFNYLINWLYTVCRYFMQRGLADYDANEIYNTGACIIGDDGGTYRSLVNANTGNTPSTSPTKWVGWALTLAQINSSQLTQATAATADNSTKVSNTAFVQAVVSQAIANLNTTLTAAIAVVQTNLNNAVTTLNAAIAAAITTAVNTANAATTAGLGINLATNGYIKLPTWASGLTIQWAQQYISASGSSPVTGTINWPIPFPNQCLSVLTTCINAAGSSTSSYSVQGYNQNNVSVSPNRRTDDVYQSATCMVWGIGF